MGKDGREAISRMFDMAREKGIIKSTPPLYYAGTENIGLINVFSSSPYEVDMTKLLIL